MDKEISAFLDAISATYHATYQEITTADLAESGPHDLQELAKSSQIAEAYAIQLPNKAESIYIVLSRDGMYGICTGADTDWFDHPDDYFRDDN